MAADKAARIEAKPITTKALSELTERAQQCAKICLKGCPAESYEAISALLTDLTALAPNMSPQQVGQLNCLMQQIFAAQQITELMALYDLTGYAIPEFLSSLKAQS
ncbi:MAG: hypothetical protein IAB19_07070 [Proteobacteria bacterium]|uniref:Uncharacterized protein n=1 Tax=Candidatus Avisuccinivibrio stercorigallinarum TaxID=2840704 RepID=A0A9D9DB31_9GAMM|nr:hypothetical protein [Candidatus Avisuccinivibrio stercorigallinarum]